MEVKKLEFSGIFPILFAPTQWCGWPGVVKGVKIDLKDITDAAMCCDKRKEIDQNKMVLCPSSL